MISAFFIFNQKGEVLISRLYRTDFKRSIADVFRIQVVSSSEVRSPIITLGSTSFFHVRINNLYVVAVTKTNANAALVFEFCYRFINICKSYFGKIDEESIKNNFTLIYELIDEINDFGYPQNSEIDTLKSYITTESVVSSAIAAEESSRITAQATGATSWRRGDVKYKKNEAFVDVVETVNLSMSAKGTILRADVDGHIQMRAYLSGTPECKFGLNDKLVIDKNDRGTVSDAVELDDCQFHQCVRLNDFDADRSISFIPPDGEFELMKYRATSNVKLPLRVIPTVTEIGTTKVSYDVTVKTNFNNKLSATGVVLRIPTPLNTTSVDCQVATGKAKYVPAENVVVWKIPRLQGGQECTFSAMAQLTSTTTRQVWARPPIDVDFQVLMFTASGLIVRFLKVFEKSNYHSIKWVRYLTKASGTYQIRHNDPDSPKNMPKLTEESQTRRLPERERRKRALLPHFPSFSDEFPPRLVLDTYHQALMFWRFGFHNASSIDSLLDKEDVALEAILDEDDLLQECKAQNTRLIDYFQRIDVLQRLFAYVTGQIEGDERGRFKYPYVATEVLCSEIWSIVETCINERQQLLVPFWETVLDRTPEDMKTQMVMASHFAKINAVFLSKKPAEMLAFIQSQPSIVERILRHIENPSLVDLLVRIIQLDEYPGGAGVLEWLSSENLMGRLIDLLSPSQPPDIHQVVADLIKGIISMATPSPGAGLTEGLQNGPASNQFARQLAREDSVSKLAVYMLQDFAPNRNVLPPESEESEAGPGEQVLPTFESATSSVIHSMGVITELIRKNNSDYFEPYLFHTLRNRLIQVQQQLSSHGDDGRETLERAMKEMVDRMGVVHLGSVLNIICDRLESFVHYLKSPRSLVGPVQTTIGEVIPLTFERFRICELFAELLHCSNMALLNRPAQYNHLYDSEGRLQGGLAALEELARVISLNNGDDRDQDIMEENIDDIEPALELPVTNASHDSPSLLDSDEDMSSDDDEPGSSDDDAMEEIVMYDEPQSLNAADTPSPTGTPQQSPPGSSPDAAQGSPLAASGRSSSGDSTSSTVGPRSHGSRRSSRRMTASENAETLVVGEKLKKRFLELNVLSTLLASDLFFEFPWNNFLHNAVYDVFHQILTGQVDSGYNRELALSLFRDARLMHRIVEGQKHNDEESAKPKGVRLGYMGHLTLMSEDVITALERFPPELRLIIIQYAPDPGWDEYVTGRYRETKKRDTILLGGGKPSVISNASKNGASKWKVDEEEANTLTLVSSNGEDSGSREVGGSEMKGEFRRSTTGRITREASADFGLAPMDEEDNDDDRDPAPHFTQYGSNDLSTGSGSDDEDDEGGWLSQSTFSLSNPTMSSLSERRPLGANSFDDVFDPGATTRHSLSVSDDPFASADDDGFGPFSDSSAVSGADPFTFSPSFSDEMEDSSFDSFGDFGDFQSAEPSDGELTPTAGSWTFTSDLSAGPDDIDVVGSGSEGSRPGSRAASLEPSSPEEDKRMAEGGKGAGMAVHIKTPS